MSFRDASSSAPDTPDMKLRKPYSCVRPFFLPGTTRKTLKSQKQKTYSSKYYPNGKRPLWRLFCSTNSCLSNPMWCDHQSVVSLSHPHKNLRVSHWLRKNNLCAWLTPKKQRYILYIYTIHQQEKHIWLVGGPKNVMYIYKDQTLSGCPMQD